MQRQRALVGRSRYVGCGDVTLHVRDAGPADGEPVVLLHGFPEFWYGWHAQIAALAEAGYRVLAPDQRGYNESDKPGAVSAYRLDRLAGDVVGLLDATGHGDGANGYDRAHVVGHDWGAMVAWWLALDHPDRVERLVTMNVPHPGVFGEYLRQSWRQRLRSSYAVFFQVPWLPERVLAARDYEALVDAVAGSARPGAFTDEDLRRYRTAWGREGALTGMLNWYRAAGRDPSFARREDRVTVPTLVLWGERDRFLDREMGAASAATCDDGRVEYVDATHWLHHERPDLVSERLQEFL